MSWPVRVVPSQCAAEGGASTSGPKACGSCRTSKGPNSARNTKNPRMPRPSRILKERRLERLPNRCGRKILAAFAFCPIVLPVRRCSVVFIAIVFLPFLAHARIENDITDIGKEIGAKHRNGDHQKDALHEWEII